MTGSETALPEGRPAAAARDLAPRGVLRAAINTANPVLARDNDGELQGVSVDIARELGQCLSVPVELVRYDTAGRVFHALDRDEWDLAFLAIEPARADKVLFTPPYIGIEGTYVVRDSARFVATGDLDQDGVRIGVGLNAAYDLYLTRTLKQAEIVRAPTPTAAIELFARGDLDAAAGVRQALEAFAQANAGLRVLPDAFMAIEQALAIPPSRQAGAAYLQTFLEHIKSSGWLRRTLDQHDLASVSIALQ